jgi:DNA-binding NarL/FixJ family response regulator
MNTDQESMSHTTLQGPNTPSGDAPVSVSAIRVLLVDDHVMVREALRSVLDGHTDIDVVGEASDGEEAVASVERLCPAIVVMDINMPRMNGVKATHRIKAQHPDIPIIGLTVNAEGDNETAMLKAGASHLLMKEAAFDELYRAIQNLLVKK